MAVNLQQRFYFCNLWKIACDNFVFIWSNMICTTHTIMCPSSMNSTRIAIHAVSPLALGSLASDCLDVTSRSCLRECKCQNQPSWTSLNFNMPAWAQELPAFIVHWPNPTSCITLFAACLYINFHSFVAITTTSYTCCIDVKAKTLLMMGFFQ